MAELVDKADRVDDLQERLEKLNKRHANEFRILLGTPPNPKNVPQSFWEKVRKDNENELAAMLLLILLASYDGHRIWGDLEAPEDTTRRDRFAERWVNKAVTAFGKEFASRSLDILNLAGSNWDVKIRRGEDVPRESIDDLIRKIFGPERMQAIAHTEMQIAMVEGGDAGIIHSNRLVTRYWGHTGYRPKGHCGAALKPCPTCTPLEGLPESQWGGKRPGSIHPRCDCFIVYVDQDDFVIGTDSPGLRPGDSPNKTWKFRKP